MAIDSASIALIFGIPTLILAWTQRITARLWVAIYLTSVLSGTYLSTSEFSTLWVLDLVSFAISTILLVAFTTLLSPLPKGILQSILDKAHRDSEDVGIDQTNTYDPAEEGKNIEIDIVAVNGLGAHPERTWMVKDHSQIKGSRPHYVSWLKDLLPKNFPHARIMPFRQNTSYLVNAPCKSIEECGQQLVDDMIRIRRTQEEKERSILFIGHSFGGIVVKQALILAAKDPRPDVQAISQSTSGILFLGTPHHGAWPSALGKIVVDCCFWLGGSSEIMDDLGYQSTKLKNLAIEFLDVYKNREMICMYETKKTYMYGILPLLVVNQESATIDGRGVLLETDHSGLNKFASCNANYNIVVTQIQKLIDGYSQVDEKNIEKCLEGLNPVGSLKSTRERISSPAKNTCDWVKKYVNEFCTNTGISLPDATIQNGFLKDGSPKTLLLQGPPGAGKSVLSRYIMDYLEGHGVEVRYYIFKATEKSNSQANPAIRTLIHQLLDKDHKLYRHIRDYREKITAQSPRALSVLVKIFKDMMFDERSKSIVIVIDALNECNEMLGECDPPNIDSANYGSRKDLMKMLSGLGSEITGRFIITTQHFTGLTKTFPKDTSMLINLESLAEVKDAVKVVIEDQVKQFFDGLQFDEFETGRELEKVKKEYESLQKELMGDMKMKAGNMFLWVFLFIGRLENLTSSAPEQFRQEMMGLPKELIPLYEELFRRKLSEGAELQAAIAQKLPWILYAQRPLRIDELRNALAMQDYKKSQGEHKWTTHNIRRRGEDGERSGLLNRWRSRTLTEDIRRNFGSLVIVERSEIRFFHQSLGDSLHGRYNPPSEIFQSLCKTPNEEHAEIAITCMNYLAIPDFNVPFRPEERSIFFEDFPFLRYAAEMWPHHTREAGGDDPRVVECFKTLACLDKNLEFGFRIYASSTGFKKGEHMPVLYKLVELGLEKLAIKRVEAGDDVHLMNSLGEHLLHSVAFQGYQKLLELLLAKGAKLDVRDQAEQTALHFAAQTGQTHMILILIALGLRGNIDDPGRNGWTALHYASYHKHLDTIAALLKEGANAARTDDSGLTPRKLLLRGASDARDQKFLDIARSLMDRMREYSGDSCGRSTSLTRARRLREFTYSSSEEKKSDKSKDDEDSDQCEYSDSAELQEVMGEIPSETPKGSTKDVPRGPEDAVEELRSAEPEKPVKYATQEQKASLKGHLIRSRTL